MPSQAVIDLVARTSNFNRRLALVTNSLNKLRDRMESVSRAARRMFLVSAAAATGATFAFASFEQQMARVKGLSGATEKEFAKLSATARRMGEETVFTANQAADAMGAFALQGFKTEEIIAALTPTLNLAAAAQLEMGQAAGITAGIMKGMKLDVSELGHVVDVLAKAATSSATDVPQLGEAMKALGPIAQASGASLEEVVGILKAFADVTITGSQAGTSLRNIFIRLQGGSSEVRKALDFLKVSIKDATTGAMKPLADIVEELTGAMSQYDAVTRQALTTAIAGTRAAAAFTTILSLGADKLREYTRGLQDSAGTAQRLADVQINTLTGSFKLLVSAITELGIALGEKFGVAARASIDLFKKLTDSVNELSDATKTLIAVIGGSFIVLTAFGALASPLLKVLAGLTFAVGVFKNAMLVLFGTILVVEFAILKLIVAMNPLVAVLLVLAAYLTIAAKKWEEYKRRQFEAREEIDATTSALQSSIQGFDKVREAMEKVNRLGKFKFEDQIFLTKKLIALQKDLQKEIADEAKQRGQAGSDEQRADIKAQADRAIAQIQRQIDAEEHLNARRQKTLDELEARDKKRSDANAAFIEERKQREREAAALVIAFAKRVADANVLAEERIREVINATRLAKGEITESGLELEKAFESGVGVDRIVRMADEMKKLKDVEKESTMLDALKAEADAMRELVKTDAQRKQEQLDRINILLAEKQITAETARLARQQLETKKEEARLSQVGRIEGLRATFTRINQAAASRVPVSSPVSSANVTATATKVIAKESGETNTILENMFNVFIEFIRDFNLVGVFGR